MKDINGRILTDQYPGIDLLKTTILSRTIDKSRMEHIGLGFMHKPGKKIDEKDQCLSKYALIYVIRGRGEYLDPHGNSHQLGPGSVFQRLPEVVHSTFLDPDSNWAECFIDFGTNLYNSLVAYKIIRDDQFVYHITPDKTIESECFEMMNRLENSSEAEMPFLAADVISLLSRIMRSCTSVEESVMNRIINQSCIYFSKNPAKRIELKTYCKENGIGYEHFRKLFRQQIGISPGQYIVNRRMDAACQMLRISQAPINEIATELGYSSQYEFSAQFKKFIGISPKVYRG